MNRVNDEYDVDAPVSWFAEKPTVTDGRWRCPRADCDGVMVRVGTAWPTADPGYHHGCTTCGLALAIPLSVMNRSNITLSYQPYFAGIVEGIRRARSAK